VRHDVVGKAAKHDPLARNDAIAALILGIREIPEKQRFVFFRIERVRIRKRVGRDLQLMPAEAPAQAPTECVFKPRQNAHGNRIDILLVESGVGKEFRVAGILERVAKKIVFVKELDGPPERIARRIIIDDVDAVPPGAGRELLGRDFDSGAKDSGRPSFADPHAGILSNDRDQIGSGAYGLVHRKQLLKSTIDICIKRRSENSACESVVDAEQAGQDRGTFYQLWIGI